MARHGEQAISRCCQASARLARAGSAVLAPSWIAPAVDMTSDPIGEAQAYSAATDAELDELQRLFACMVGAQAPDSLAQVAVLGMEMDLFRKGWPVGLSLGALQDVQKRFGLGRPASHAAIKILEARGLLDVRRGPGGGVFVAAPSLDDVAGAVLVQLALNGATLDCIEEFRLLVWQMMVNAALVRSVPPPPAGKPISAEEFIADLADRLENPAMRLMADLAAKLVEISLADAQRKPDAALDLAIRQGDLALIFARLGELSVAITRDAPVIAFDVAERAFSLSGRKSAMALAAKMARELSAASGPQEAEWETADRLGYTDAVVRQARRILQDFGMVRCRQGRKGAEMASSAAPTGVIRLMASYMVVNASLQVDKLEAIAFLVSSAPVLAARRVRDGTGAPDFTDKRFSMANVVDALTLENLVVELSGNPLLEIAVRSLGLSNLFIASAPLVPPNLGAMLEVNRKILQAIVDGDVQAAQELAFAKLDMMQQFARDEREIVKRNLQQSQT